MIDTSKLDSPWAEEKVGHETFPHIRGPLNTSAVKDVIPLDKNGNTPPMRQMIIKDVSVPAWELALMVMALSVSEAWSAEAVASGAGAGVGALGGLALGVLLVWLFYRFRRN